MLRKGDVMAQIMQLDTKTARKQNDFQMLREAEMTKAIQTLIEKTLANRIYDFHWSKLKKAKES